MHAFKDAKGREWELRLTLGLAMRIKDKLGVDLLTPEAGDPPLMTRFGTDEIFLGEILCEMLIDQVEKNEATVQDLADSFDGETLLRAQIAFYEELADFFQARGRNDRATALRAQHTLIRKAISRVEKELTDERIQEMADAIAADVPFQMNEMLGKLSGGLPDKSELTQEG